MRIEDGARMRRARKDCTIKTFAKTRNIPEESLRHKNGRKMRKDKTIDSVRKQYGEDSI